MSDLTREEREALGSWRSIRSPGWHHDIGYVLQDVIQAHRYEIGRKGDKPDDPGWHECICGWAGYWSGFEPHVADHLRLAVSVALTAREQAASERGAAEEREWFKSALTSDVGDLLDVEWLRENWWVKHVVAAHLDGPPALDADPSPSADDEGVAR